MSVNSYYARALSITDQELTAIVCADPGHTSEYYADSVLFAGDKNAVGPKTRSELRTIFTKRLRAAQRTTMILRLKRSNSRGHIFMVR